MLIEALEGIQGSVGIGKGLKVGEKLFIAQGFVVRSGASVLKIDFGKLLSKQRVFGAIGI